MRRRSILTTFLFTTALLIVLFLWRGGHWLVVETPLQPADAIVMLRGSTPERELEVAQLFNEGLADHVLFVDFSTHNTRLLDSLELDLPLGVANTITTLQHLGIPESHITILKGDISSTRGEAIAIRQYLETAGEATVRTKDLSPQRIIIVSSPPHMRRARLLFRRELRKLQAQPVYGRKTFRPDVELIMRPSPYSDFQAKGWYRHRESARSVVFEYVKLAAGSW